MRRAASLAGDLLWQHSRVPVNHLALLKEDERVSVSQCFPAIVTRICHERVTCFLPLKLEAVCA